MYHAGDPMVLVAFRLPERERERVRKLAQERGMGMSEWLREAVERGLVAQVADGSHVAEES